MSSLLIKVKLFDNRFLPFLGCDEYTRWSIQAQCVWANMCKSFNYKAIVHLVPPSNVMDVSLLQHDQG